MEVNGWKLYGHKLFVDQIVKLIDEVKSLKEGDPSGYESHPKDRGLNNIQNYAFCGLAV
jgi:hypothetical protein